MSTFKTDVREYLDWFQRDQLVFYDVEVYNHDAFVVFLDIDRNEVAYFHSDTGFDGISDLVEKSLLVGYNNYFYDDHILTAMMNNYPVGKLKKINDEIIKGQGAQTRINSHIKSLDCFQQVDVSRPSLKKIEANKGVDIEETPVDFDIDRPLTEEELERAIYYCRYDVGQTIDVFKDRFYNYFKPKQYVVGLLERTSPNAYRWNTTTISAQVVRPIPPNPRNADILVPEELLNWVPDDVVEMWKTQEKGKVKHQAFNNTVEFGFGGLHSVHNHKKKFKNVVVADFTSLYPNIMINHRLLDKYTDNLKELVDRRVNAKHEMQRLLSKGDLTPEKEREVQLLDAEQSALKLVINSVYGLLKNEYSTLYDPKVSTTVCAIGQCMLFELANRLSSCAAICQTNTDGIFFVPNDDRYKEICEEFAKEVGIELDYDFFEELTQKDVNNYIAKHENGSLYLKGGDTNMYYKANPYRTVSARVCQIALVDHIAYDKPILDTLLEHRDDPSVFQYVLQAGSTYQGTFDDDDREYQKVNRVFASLDDDAVTLRKKRRDGGLVSYANAPEKMFVWNRNIKDLENFRDHVDLGHYMNIANRMVSLWEK